MSAPASIFQTTPVAAPKTLPPAEIAQSLGDLLNRYVALLEGSWRSGWSVDEEETVRDVCTQLARVKGLDVLSPQTRASLRLRFDPNRTPRA
jgi:hypothetical protein